jgi:F0F1-type ATP synthase membrane subunit b/b'
MVASTDMSTPVTRGELREELKQFKQELKQELRQDLEIWGGALAARIDAGEQRMLAELARHAKAIQEAMSTQISAIDEKYADLPARVSRLEAAVFVPERR